MYRDVKITKNTNCSIQQTRLAVTEDRVNEIKSPFQHASENIQALISRMQMDLKNEVFEESTVKMIEDIRLITDLKSPAMSILNNGAIVVGH